MPHLLRHLLPLGYHAKRQVLVREVGQLQPRGAAFPDDDKLDGIAAIHQERDAKGVLPCISWSEVQRNVQGLTRLEHGGLARGPEATVSFVEAVEG